MKWRQCTWVLKAKHGRGFKGMVHIGDSLFKDRDPTPEIPAMVDSKSSLDMMDQGEMGKMTEVAIDHDCKILERELLKVFQDVSDVTVELAIRLK